jgi:hypothetical protein
LIVFWSALAGLLFSLVVVVGRDWLNDRRAERVSEAAVTVPMRPRHGEFDLGPSH